MSLYSQNIGSRAAAPTASWVIDVAAQPAAGNAVLLEHVINGTGIITAVTDTHGNTWTLIGNPAFAAIVERQRLAEAD